MPSTNQSTARTGDSVVAIPPRSLRENDAAAYCGFSGSYFRNLRVADMRRQSKGEPIDGPRWINIGTAVRYLRDDLDAWLDGHKGAAA